MQRLFSKSPFLLIFFISLGTFAQDTQPLLFSTTIDAHIREHNKKTEIAFLQNDMARVNSLFDSLVNNIIVGTQLDNFYINKKSGRQIQLYKFKKPLFIITYSDWYPLEAEEIRAFNKIVKEHHKSIDFLAIFWSSQSKAKQASKKFSKTIHVLYADEIGNRSDNIIKTMKHSLGVPTALFTDKAKVILDVGRLPAYNFQKNAENSYKTKYDYFKSGVETIQKTALNK